MILSILIWIEFWIMFWFWFNWIKEKGFKEQDWKWPLILLFIIFSPILSIILIIISIKKEEIEILFRPTSFWVGAHWSKTNQRLCINIIPFVTIKTDFELPQEKTYTTDQVKNIAEQYINKNFCNRFDNIDFDIYLSNHNVNQ